MFQPRSADTHGTTISKRVKTVLTLKNPQILQSRHNTVLGVGQPALRRNW